jgi:hypothetical protein
MEVSRNYIDKDKIIDFGDKRFLKLPIENYLSLRNFEPIPPQIALINAINDPRHRFVVAALSRRTGKTEISNIIAQLVILVPGTNVLIMSPNYQLSSISWDKQRQLLKEFDIEVIRDNAKDKIIELKNGSVIRMGAISQADSVVGRSYDLILFDEAALNDKGADVFNIQLRPTLDKVNSKAIFISTPRGQNWFHEFWRRGFEEDYPNWVSLKSTWRDNPRANTEDIDEARRTMSRAEFEQEYECAFNVLRGAIYNLDKETCIREINLGDIQVFDIIAGLDIGFRDATAMAVMATDGHNYYVIDEYQDSGKTTAEHAEAIQKLVEKWKIDLIYIDAAAAQTRYDLAQNFDIPSINAKKSVLDGIGYVGSMISQKRVIVDVNCRYTLDSIDGYKWDDKEGLIREKPVHDEFSHMADALRYAMYSHAANLETM